MKTYNGITLEYKHQKRDNYMSLVDLVKDLTTDSLLEVLPTLTKFTHQMDVMREIEKRNELDDDYFYELLESCNGV